MPVDRGPVLILGAGINGAALARELVLGGISVVVVDSGDLAGGATSYSSRLIHGGLRYLEYGEFDLVRESLAERTRLLRLAPHLVRPLKLYIPVSNRLGGLRKSVRRFLGRKSNETTRPDPPRGLWLVRAGLWLYDRYARDLFQDRFYKWLERPKVWRTIHRIQWAVFLGLGGAWALTRYLHALLFGVTERDPVTFTVTPILLAVIVLAASPARRALHIDPAIALRDE